MVPVIIGAYLVSERTCSKYVAGSNSVIVGVLALISSLLIAVGVDVVLKILAHR